MTGKEKWKNRDVNRQKHTNAVAGKAAHGISEDFSDSNSIKANSSGQPPSLHHLSTVLTIEPQSLTELLALP